MIGGEGGQERGEEEGGGESLGWVNEYWSLGESGSCRRSSTRGEEEEESPTMVKRKEVEDEEGEEGEEELGEGEEGNVLDQEDEEEEEDKEGAGERGGGFPSKQEE